MESNVINAQGSNFKPTADHIKANMPDGKTPMDVLNAIVNREEPVNPQQMVNDAKPPVVEPVADPVVEPVVETPVNPSPLDTSPVQTEEIEDDVEEPQSEGKSLKDNFKHLKSTYKETKKILKEREERLAAVEKEIEEIKTGKVLPEYVIEKEKELERLRHFEKLHSLKTSKAYNDTFIKPINETKTKLYEIAKEYEIPENIIDEALNLTDRRQVNRFLESHFDTLDAIKVKDLFENVKSLTTKAREAELEPSKMLQDLAKEGEQIEAQRRISLQTTVEERQNKAWVKALNTIRQEGKAIELIPKADDSEFNKTYVEPILTAAGTEFGKIVASITSKLSEPLTEDEMYYLARMTQLAHASAVSIETRNRALNVADSLLETSRRTSKMVRPPVGSQQAGGSKPVVKTETRDDRLNSLIQQGRDLARK